MEPIYHWETIIFCHKDVITVIPPPSQTPTSGSGQQQQQNKGLIGPAGGLYIHICIKE
jgi:hypothetical protein